MPQTFPSEIIIQTPLVPSPHRNAVVSPYCRRGVFGRLDTFLRGRLRPREERGVRHAHERLPMSHEGRLSQGVGEKTYPIAVVRPAAPHLLRTAHFNTAAYFKRSRGLITCRVIDGTASLFPSLWTAHASKIRS